MLRPRVTQRITPTGGGNSLSLRNRVRVREMPVEACTPGELGVPTSVGIVARLRACAPRYPKCALPVNPKLSLEALAFVGNNREHRLSSAEKVHPKEVRSR